MGAHVDAGIELCVRTWVRVRVWVWLRVPVRVWVRSHGYGCRYSCGTSGTCRNEYICGTMGGGVVMSQCGAGAGPELWVRMGVGVGAGTGAGMGADL